MINWEHATVLPSLSMLRGKFFFHDTENKKKITEIDCKTENRKDSIFATQNQNFQRK